MTAVLAAAAIGAGAGVMFLTGIPRPLSPAVSETNGRVLGAVAPHSAECSGLEKIWREVSVDLAGLGATDIGETSVPRSSLTALNVSIEFQKATLLVELLKAYDCKIPISLPSGQIYMSYAVKCLLDRENGKAASEACDSSKWKEWGSPH